ncbi:MAG: 4Fe-4S binding protein [Sedimentisphaerales bacterium]|nr:4Fe-4S binding protein [Sedimentisphaerales bacterium]MBN2844216.1 4Fe-4S binding protein [Sedimentisphaerales bacterium]
MSNKKMDRREFMQTIARFGAISALGAVGWLAVKKPTKAGIALEGGSLWQIDPNKCTHCGKCATLCVLKESAVKCLHKSDICGYCDLCTGYYYPEPSNLDTAAENQVCPTGALIRKFVEEPYFQYEIDEKLCIGCGRCVKGCTAFGNGALYLQIMHDRCLNCNICAIAVECPDHAIIRVPAQTPYFQKTI